MVWDTPNAEFGWVRFFEQNQRKKIGHDKFLDQK